MIISKGGFRLPLGGNPGKSGLPGMPEARASPHRSSRELHRVLTEHFGPPSMLVHRSGEIVHLAGGADVLLEFGADKPEAAFLGVVHTDVRAELGAAFLQATQTGCAVDVCGLQAVIGGKEFTVDFRVVPTQEVAPDHVLVTFFLREDAPGAELPAILAAGADFENLFRIQERDLHQTRARLTTSIDASALASKELKLSRDQLLAMIEERRVSTAALGVSRERLLTASAELRDVNLELYAEITRRELADDEHHDTEHRFQQLFNQGCDAAFVHDLARRLVAVNDAACAGLGFSRIELLGMGVGDVEMTPPPAEGHRFWTDLVSGSVEKFEGRHRRKDGSTFCVDNQVSVLDRPEGRCLIAVVREITGRKQTEADLVIAQAEIVRSHGATDAFLSRMSHELRTPLNAILGFGQLLELTARGQNDVASVQHILTGGRHLLGMIDDVLDMTHFDPVGEPLVLGEVDVGRLMQECVELLGPLARTRGVSCQVAKDRSWPVIVLGDEGRLRQMLLNLLASAIKYNREDGRVLLGFQKMASGRVRLEVSDTGPGISRDGIKRLFVPFERLGQEYSEVKGTGLGLVVSRKLAEAMGGSLGVKSETGHGSTFWIELPASAGPAPRSQHAEL